MLPPVVEGMWLYVLFHIQIQQHNLASVIVYCLQVHVHVMSCQLIQHGLMYLYTYKTTAIGYTNLKPSFTFELIMRPYL